MEIQVGTVLELESHKYTITESIDSGGNGTVWKATIDNNARLYAIKVLRDGKDKDKDKDKDKGKGKGKGDGNGDGTGDDDQTGDDDKNKGKGGDNNGDDEPVVVEGNTFEERIAFIGAKLTEINTELNEIAMQEEAFKGQTTSIAQDQLKLLETRRKKLELIKSKYQIELMKMTGTSYTATDMGEQDLSAGGMKK